MVSLDIDWEDLGASAMPTPKAVFCGHA